MVNQVMLIGRIGAEPELRQFDNGTTKVSFPLATTRSHKGPDGERKTVTQWHQVAFFNNPGLVKMVDNHVSKGCLVAVQGHIEYRKYNKADGTVTNLTEILLSQLNVLKYPHKGKSDAADDDTTSESTAAPTTAAE